MRAWQSSTGYAELMPKITTFGISTTAAASSFAVRLRKLGVPLRKYSQLSAAYDAARLRAVATEVTDAAEHAVVAPPSPRMCRTCGTRQAMRGHDLCVTCHRAALRNVEAAQRADEPAPVPAITTPPTEPTDTAPTGCPWCAAKRATGSNRLCTPCFRKRAAERKAGGRVTPPVAASEPGQPDGLPAACGMRRLAEIQGRIPVRPSSPPIAERSALPPRRPTLPSRAAPVPSAGLTAQQRMAAAVARHEATAGPTPPPRRDGGQRIDPDSAEVPASALVGGFTRGRRVGAPRPSKAKSRAGRVAGPALALLLAAAPCQAEPLAPYDVWVRFTPSPEASAHVAVLRPAGEEAWRVPFHAEGPLENGDVEALAYGGDPTSTTTVSILAIGPDCTESESNSIDIPPQVSQCQQADLNDDGAVTAVDILEAVRLLESGACVP